MEHLKYLLLFISVALLFSCSKSDVEVDFEDEDNEVIPEPKKPVKVFILAGQSNMLGHGEVEKSKPGSLDWIVQNDTDKKFKHLVDSYGKWIIRDDVFVFTHNIDEQLKHGGLSVGYGAFDYTIGPELGFGNIIGDHYENDVLLIKTSWGGKDLAINFCSPSSISKYGYTKPPSAAKDTGYYYVQMHAIVNNALKNISMYVPSYSDRGYEIIGFGWHQGWNDRVNTQKNNAYENNLYNFINDVRKDLDKPKLPFVIATTSMKSYTKNDPKEISLIQAQKAMTTYPEFEGNVKVVDTAPFWRSEEESPAKQNYHWHRNAESYYLIGESMAVAMLELLEAN